MAQCTHAYVKYSAEHDNYYCETCHQGMGDTYYEEAKRREWAGLTINGHSDLMDDKFLDFVKDLTKADTKNLVGMTAKAAEELGELARVTLPFENMSGTLHRFTTKEAIIEECADLMLVALSIVYRAGGTDEDLDKMLLAKARKWHGLQAAEARVVGKTIPYEIHVTVESIDIDVSFEMVCEHLKVKPICLELYTKDGSGRMDWQTASVYFGNNHGAYTEMKRISAGLTKAGFKVIREKIETVPWHPAAPQKAGDKMPANCYFECHYDLLVPKTLEGHVTQISETYDAPISRSRGKPLIDGAIQLMITRRDYDTHLEKFEESGKYLEESLIGFASQDKTVIEFSIFDTNISHDAYWIH